RRAQLPHEISVWRMNSSGKVHLTKTPLFSVTIIPSVIMCLCNCFVLCPFKAVASGFENDFTYRVSELPLQVTIFLPVAPVLKDLRDPFYTDQYDQEHIKPPVIRLLLSCELYCRVCALILKTEQAASLQSHMSVIQALSRKGIYVMESDDTPVTDGDLACIPIKMSAHISMIDALMMAYTVEMISIEKVVASVKRFSTFSASKELPFDLEDAMVFWINKVLTDLSRNTAGH
ncbi:Calmodulin-regulated spectrin-associated protein 1-B, partial [Xenotaenia resolanae]